jgi:hypothetical protein
MLTIANPSTEKAKSKTKGGLNCFIGRSSWERVLAPG